MDKENSIKDLFKPNKCSPIIAYFLILLISIVIIINAKETSKKLQDNYKILNVFKLFTYSELVFLLVHGIILFGLCQHGKETIAWITLLFPLFGYLIKNIIVFISLYTIQKSEPPKDKIDNKDESSQQQTQITDLPVTLPPTNNVMESQKQMLKFNQALQNNALQNLVNRDQNNEMNPPLDNNFNNMQDPMPIPSNF
ncbi:MAG: hypothetical protein CMI95_01235 [Pelagibacteraceae bacterium]|nr:hypothetical protein [Pelagibacteraceae bacterium]|tara:strand:+ start:3725 stop:4315 length:591 start_codon:yes stop_codon:yes gene_type:complete